METETIFSPMFESMEFKTFQFSIINSFRHKAISVLAYINIWRKELSQSSFK